MADAGVGVNCGSISVAGVSVGGIEAVGTAPSQSVGVTGIVKGPSSRMISPLLLNALARQIKSPLRPSPVVGSVRERVK